jgi:hypothetical protein
LHPCAPDTGVVPYGNSVKFTAANYHGLSFGAISELERTQVVESESQHRDAQPEIAIVIDALQETQ